MNIVAIWQFATVLGQAAKWPVFTFVLLAFGLNYTLTFRRENQKLRRERIADHQNAVAKANKLIGGLDKEVFSDEEFTRIKTGIMQVAGIDISLSANAESPTSAQQADATDTYNKFNIQALKVSFWTSVVYVPAAIVAFIVFGWHPSMHLYGIAFVKSYSKNTTAYADVSFGSFMPVFFVIFLAIKIFCARSSSSIQTQLSCALLSAMVTMTVMGAALSEVYLP